MFLLFITVFLGFCFKFILYQHIQHKLVVLCWKLNRYIQIYYTVKQTRIDGIRKSQVFCQISCAFRLETGHGNNCFKVDSMLRRVCESFREYEGNKYWVEANNIDLKLVVHTAV